MVKRMFAWETVLAEIAKCDLVCVRCHRLRTYNGSNCYKTIRFEHHKLVLDKLKSSLPCLDCGEMFQPCQMDFDHVASKTSSISQLVGEPSATLIKELSKCHLVCANCHREREFSGIRPDIPDHGPKLVALFHHLLETVPVPEDGRCASFPLPHLLGKVPDKELAKITDMSWQMVAWYRRKAGIVLRQGRRAA
jgi:hypothetical protein